MNWIASYDINEIQMHVYRNLICRVQSFALTWIFIKITKVVDDDDNVVFNCLPLFHYMYSTFTTGVACLIPSKKKINNCSGSLQLSLSVLTDRN